MSYWSTLIGALHDWNGQEQVLLPGADLLEVLLLVQSDYDWIDALYIDLETLGGE